jgi:protein-tyrosine-phosphatase
VDAATIEESREVSPEAALAVTPNHHLEDLPQVNHPLDRALKRNLDLVIKMQRQHLKNTVKFVS